MGKSHLRTINNQKEINQEVFFDIDILKRIPLSSGVGAGSSNVACLFKFLLKLGKLDLNKKIKKIILKVGSDVMFFVKEYEIAKVWNFGEKVKKIKTNKEIKIKLLFNNIKCETKKVFQYFDINHKKNIKNSYLKQFLYFKINRNDLFKNDLELSSFEVYNELLIELKKLKNKYDKKIYLSGSGGTFFLIED